MTAIELTQIVKTFSHPTGEIKVLDGISLSVERGETLAIVGQSGSGKSTLLSLLAGLDHPTSGTVMMLGERIANLRGDALISFRAKHLGIVFQQFHLIPHLTALENVELPLRIQGVRDYRLKALKALDDVSLKNRSGHLPRELSGGECQRVAIARAMVHIPEIILADEPSGNLDTDTGEKVMSLLFEVAKKHNSTLILVTHNSELAALCNRTLKLSRGHFINA